MPLGVQLFVTGLMGFLISLTLFATLKILDREHRDAFIWILTGMEIAILCLAIVLAWLA